VVVNGHLLRESVAGALLSSQDPALRMLFMRNARPMGRSGDRRDSLDIRDTVGQAMHEPWAYGSTFGGIKLKRMSIRGNRSNGF
jgi:hypothetical protein